MATMSTAAGLIDLGFAAFHLMFWRLFGWPKILVASGEVNSAVTQTLNFVLTYVFIAYGGALIWLGEAAPAAMLWAGAGFWVLRAALQPALFPMRNKPSVIILAVFLTAGAVHAAAAWAG